MYGSLLFLCWGFFFKQPSLAGGVLAVIASGFLVVTARAEEIENLRYFGEEYREYMKRTGDVRAVHHLSKCSHWFLH